MVGTSIRSYRRIVDDLPILVGIVESDSASPRYRDIDKRYLDGSWSELLADNPDLRLRLSTDGSK